jgi:hypothetical protein
MITSWYPQGIGWEFPEFSCWGEFSGVHIWRWEETNKTVKWAICWRIVGFVCLWNPRRRFELIGSVVNSWTLLKSCSRDLLRYSHSKSGLGAGLCRVCCNVGSGWESQSEDGHPNYSSLSGIWRVFWRTRSQGVLSGAKLVCELDLLWSGERLTWPCWKVWSGIDLLLS